jgi:Fe2+ or Zn2+ uptake regulation protein
MVRNNDKIIQELRKHHISVTANRVKILSIAFQLKSNINTVTVLKAIDYAIERTSVHRALRLFCKKGLLLPVPNTNRLIEYQVIPRTSGIGGNNQKKASFICLQCGQFDDIIIKEEVCEPPKKISISKVIIEGFCEQCGSGY